MGVNPCDGVVTPVSKQAGSVRFDPVERFGVLCFHGGYYPQSLAYRMACVKFHERVPFLSGALSCVTVKVVRVDKQR